MKLCSWIIHRPLKKYLKQAQHYASSLTTCLCKPFPTNAIFIILDILILLFQIWLKEICGQSGLSQLFLFRRWDCIILKLEQHFAAKYVFNFSRIFKHEQVQLRLRTQLMNFSVAQSWVILVPSCNHYLVIVVECFVKLWNLKLQWLLVSEWTFCGSREYLKLE